MDRYIFKTKRHNAWAKFSLILAGIAIWVYVIYVQISKVKPIPPVKTPVEIHENWRPVHGQSFKS